jgi:hypothetical protein
MTIARRKKVITVRNRTDQKEFIDKLFFYHSLGLTQVEIAYSLGVSRNSIGECFRKYKHLYLKPKEEIKKTNKKKKTTIVTKRLEGEPTLGIRAETIRYFGGRLRKGNYGWTLDGKRILLEQAMTMYMDSLRK